MNVGEIMTRNLQVLRPQATAREAADKMRELNIGALPVCDGQRILGMITDRDLVLRVMAEGVDPDGATVESAMSPDVKFCFEDQDAREAARLMSDSQIRRLVVLNREKRAVGILSLGDLATSREEDRVKAKVIQKISEPDATSLH